MRARIIPILIAIIASFSLTACGPSGSGGDPSQRVLFVCEDASRLLHYFAIKRSDGKLSEDTVDRIDKVRGLIDPICSQGTPPRGTEARSLLDGYVERLIRIKDEQSFKGVNDG